MRVLAVILSSILITGCYKDRIIYKPVEVEKPVYIVPKFNIPEKPRLPIEELSSNSTYEDIGKAYVSTVKILEDLTNRLYNLLEGIKKGEQ